MTVTASDEGGAPWDDFWLLNIFSLSCSIVSSARVRKTQMQGKKHSNLEGNQSPSPTVAFIAESLTVKKSLTEMKWGSSAIDLCTRMVHLTTKQQHVTCLSLRWSWLKRGGSESSQPVCLWHHCSACGTETWICWLQSWLEEMCCPPWLPEGPTACRCPPLHKATVVVIQMWRSDKWERDEPLPSKQVWNAPKQGTVRTWTTVYTHAVFK